MGVRVLAPYEINPYNIFAEAIGGKGFEQAGKQLSLTAENVSFKHQSFYFEIMRKQDLEKRRALESRVASHPEDLPAKIAYAQSYAFGPGKSRYQTLIRPSKATAVTGVVKRGMGHDKTASAMSDRYAI